MTYELTLHELITIIGAALFSGLFIGAALVAILQSSGSKEAYWEEE